MAGFTAQAERAQRKAGDAGEKRPGGARMRAAWPVRGYLLKSNNSNMSLMAGPFSGT